MCPLHKSVSKKLTPNRIAVLSMLVALQVVFGKITQIPLLEKEYNLGFIPIALAGWMMGIGAGAIVAVLGDILGALIFPTGAYFPGFTVTACIVGILYGLWLYKTRSSVYRIGLAVISTEIVNLLLNSYWLSIILTSGKSYGAILTGRAPIYLPESALQILILFVLLNILKKMNLKNVLRRLH